MRPPLAHLYFIFAPINQSSNEMKTIQEILDSTAVKAVENEILEIITKAELSKRGEYSKKSIQHLLSVRKLILDSMFILTDEYKQLLGQFNERMKNALCDMRQQAIEMHRHALAADVTNLEVTGRVFLSYKYPEKHPVQTIRAKKIWALLSGAYDSFMPLYEKGVNELYLNDRDPYPSEHLTLFLSEDIDNWNEGFDRVLTSDMQLCYGVYNLIEHTYFSIFDLLWVRDFYIEVKCETSHCTGSEDWDDIDWNIYDYL